jgi:hypothetical protein
VHDSDGLRVLDLYQVIVETAVVRIAIVDALTVNCRLVKGNIARLLLSPESEAT